MRTYRVNQFIFLLAFLFPFLLMTALGSDIRPDLRHLKSAPELTYLGGLAVAWALLIVYLAALRVDVDAQGLTYRNLFRGSIFIPFREISSTILEKRESGEGPYFMLIVTPRIWSNRKAVSIPLGLLSIRATIEVPRILAARERDTKDLLTLS
jgi:hypothetical protein